MNNKYKYKAYISYSHCDSRWATWLHRALESYRIPRKLVGTETGVGDVPSRIRPVFRDRDDLSSSADLGATVQQALTDSENMIVICSPDATASHWVNEEIRHFASLGRQNRIYCIIVDGEPASIDKASTCFPAALEEIGLHEPLAADVRKWADGKHLSKLKVVSGMLGLPLDQLRRRDLQKRQRTWVMAAVGLVVVAAILVTAITARIAAQQRRDSGESLVAYKLTELRTMLNVKNDPEDLARLDQWNQQDLGRLIGYAGVGEGALIRSAMDLREQGIALYRAGVLSEALETHKQSWALLAEAYRRDRSDYEAFFELGQAEFYIGEVYTDQGELDKAEDAFMSYAEITRRLILLQPENADWVLEMAYALSNLGFLQKDSDANNPDRALQLMQSALEYNQIALVLDPKNDYYQSELGQSHAFFADAQRGVCDLEGALQTRQTNVLLEEDILALDKENINKKLRLAWALSGLSVVQDELGKTREAIESLKKVLELMTPVLLSNPGDKKHIRYVLFRTHRTNMLEALSGDVDQAWVAMNVLQKDWQHFFQQGELKESSVVEYIAFLLGWAWLAQVQGDLDAASQSLEDARDFLLSVLDKIPGHRDAENMLMLTVFQLWEMNQEYPAESTLAVLPDYGASSGRIRSCFDASLAVRQALMQDDLALANKMTAYVLEKGYREARFMRACKKYSLCSGQ